LAHQAFLPSADVSSQRPALLPMELSFLFIAPGRTPFVSSFPSGLS